MAVKKSRLNLEKILDRINTAVSSISWAIDNAAPDDCNDFVDEIAEANSSLIELGADIVKALNGGKTRNERNTKISRA